MRKGEIYEGTVREVLFPNKGTVVTDEGETCVVKNVIPGQRVSFRTTKLRHGEAEGIKLGVVKKAENELECAGCCHFGVCGGCAYHNISYDDQLKIKETQVLRLLKNVPGNPMGVTDELTLDNNELYKGVFASPLLYGYKNKMEFSFGDEQKGGELTLGLHKRDSFYDVVPVPECKIVCEDIRKIITFVLAECRRQQLPYYHKITHEGLLRHLLVRRSEKSGEILIGLVTSSQMKMDLDAFKNGLLELPLEGSYAGILNIINDAPADAVKADRVDILYGRDYFYEELLGLKFKVSLFSFFQTNSLGAEVLYNTAKGFILEAMEKQGLLSKDAGTEEIRKNGPVIYDLYSGTGTIAQLLSPVAKEVIGVEIVEEAVEAAKVNTIGNEISNCSFIAGDVLKVIDDIETKPDFIVLDPPREGIHPKALPKLVAYGVQSMIYISCKPTSLAHDLPAFLEAGYEVTRLAMVDMFPWTMNIETVVLLSKPVDSWGRG